MKKKRRNPRKLQRLTRQKAAKRIKFVKAFKVLLYAIRFFIPPRPIPRFKPGCEPPSGIIAIVGESGPEVLTHNEAIHKLSPIVDNFRPIDFKAIEDVDRLLMDAAEKSPMASILARRRQEPRVVCVSNPSPGNLALKCLEELQNPVKRIFYTPDGFKDELGNTYTQEGPMSFRPVLKPWSLDGTPPIP